MSTLEEQVRELYVPGVVGHRQVAKKLGVPPTRVRRLLNPAFAAASNEASRLAKKRRHGTCERCGKPTSYNGRAGSGVARLCAGCNALNLNSPEAIARRTKYTAEFLLDEIRRWHALHGEIPKADEWNRSEGWPSARAVQYRFGTWNAGITAAGFTPRRGRG